jgi:hypothetical protein
VGSERVSMKSLVVCAMSLGFTLPVTLAGQTPTVTSAVLWPRRDQNPARVDAGHRTLIVWVGGLPASAIGTLTMNDVRISDLRHRTYAPEAFAMNQPEMAKGEVMSSRRAWLFRVPEGPRTFELRLRDFQPIRFVATDSAKALRQPHVR